MKTNPTIQSRFAELQEDIHKNALEKGFWDNPNISEKLALIHSEISEALEVTRKKKPSELRISNLGDYMDAIIRYDFLEPKRFELHIKDSFGDELADAIIRIMDLAKYLDIDIMTHILLKHNYNKTRPIKHGKNF